MLGFGVVGGGGHNQAVIGWGLYGGGGSYNGLYKGAKVGCIFFLPYNMFCGSAGPWQSLS